MTENTSHGGPLRGYGADVSAEISAQNTFTPWVRILGTFNLSISGIWVGTVTIQRSFDGGVTALDVNAYITNYEDKGSESRSDTVYRVGIKTGDYTSGTANVRLNQ